jgi:hypothetical protein
MTKPNDDIEATWQRVRTEVERRFQLYPAAPENAMAMPEADWPEPDLAGLLDFASTLGVHVVYAAATRLDDPEADLRDEVDGADESQLAKLQAHRGEIRRIEVAFAYGGILHRWLAEAPWWRDAVASTDRGPRRAEEEFFGFGYGYGDGVSDEQLDAWARLVAEAPAFDVAKTDVGRLRVARDLISDLGPDVAPERTAGVYSRLVNAALLVYREDVVPRLDRQLAPDAQRLLAEGLKKYQIEARLNVGRARLNRILSLDT